MVVRLEILEPGPIQLIVQMGILVLLQPHQLISSGYNNLTLQFNSYYREYRKAKVSFSNDGGTSWTNPIEVHPNIGINNAYS